MQTLDRELEQVHGLDNTEYDVLWAIGGPESEQIAAVPGHNEIKTGTVRANCNDLGIPTPRRR